MRSLNIFHNMVKVQTEILSTVVLKTSSNNVCYGLLVTSYLRLPWNPILSMIVMETDPIYGDDQTNR